MSKGAPLLTPLTIHFRADSPMLPGVVWENISRVVGQPGRILQTVGDLMGLARSIPIENQPEYRYQILLTEGAEGPALPQTPTTPLPADGNIFVYLDVVRQEPAPAQPAYRDVKGAKRGGRKRRRRRKKRHTKKKKKKRRRRSRRRTQ